MRSVRAGWVWKSFCEHSAQRGKSVLIQPLEIRRLAVVNRGEAAMRCIRAVKALRTLEDITLEVVAPYTASESETV